MDFDDPIHLPLTGENPEQRFARAWPLPGTVAEGYVERRGIPVTIAHRAGVRFDGAWGGRPAVIVPMRDQNGLLCAVHGRYLEHPGQEKKMLTVGVIGGVISVLDGWRTEPIVLVEGLFDALSLAVCGASSVATVGRWASWLVEVCDGRRVFLAFDGNKPGEADCELYRRRLSGARISRLPPPGRSKDWNTALVKRGRATVEAWLDAKGVPRRRQ